MGIRQIAIGMIIILNFSCNKQQEGRQQEQEQQDQEQEQEERKVILFFGNSLTAGYGVEGSEAYPTLIQEKLDSLGYEYEVINAGVSGETTSGGLGRIDWVLEKKKVDIFVLELGANDGLRGISPNETYSNLKKIIEKVQDQYPDVEIILAGMMIPPNMGQDYSDAFKNIFPRIAKEENIGLIPFLLKDIGGIDSLNQSDRVHPNAKGHKIMARNVWEVLEDYLME